MLTGGKAMYAEKLPLCHFVRHQSTVRVRRTHGLPVPEFDLIFVGNTGHVET